VTMAMLAPRHSIETACPPVRAGPSSGLRYGGNWMS